MDHHRRPAPVRHRLGPDRPRLRRAAPAAGGRPARPSRDHERRGQRHTADRRAAARAARPVLRRRQPGHRPPRASRPHPARPRSPRRQPGRAPALHRPGQGHRPGLLRLARRSRARHPGRLHRRRTPGHRPVHHRHGGLDAPARAGAGRTVTGMRAAVPEETATRPDARTGDAPQPRIERTEAPGRMRRKFPASGGLAAPYVRTSAANRRGESGMELACESSRGLRWPPRRQG